MLTFKLKQNTFLYTSSEYHNLTGNYLKLLDITLPYSFYMVRSPYNAITLKNLVTLNTEVINLTPSSYSNLTDFTSKLELDLNTNTIAIVFTVTYDQYTSKLTIAGDVNFQITGYNYILRDMWGFVDDSSLNGAATYTSDNIINLNPTQSFNIVLYINNYPFYKNIAFNYEPDTSGNPSTSTVFNTSLTLYLRQRVEFGNLVEYDFKEDNIILFESVNKFTLSKLKIQIFDSYNQEIDFNGSLIFLTYNLI